MDSEPEQSASHPESEPNRLNLIEEIQNYHQVGTLKAHFFGAWTMMANLRNGGPRRLLENVLHFLEDH